MTDLLAGPSPGNDESPARSGSPLSAAALRSHGSRPACFDCERVVTHEELADLVDERRRVLGAMPRLVVLYGANTLDFVVSYLAALDGAHPVIVAADASSATSLGAVFGASARIDASASGSVRIDAVDGSERGRGGDLGWHRDLAALMSTSGSTGSAKLVRLSLDAVTSNAISIAASLGLRDDDRAITSLPLHYCYGLSVVTSHLAVGASVVFTDAAVVDPCFWAAVDDHEVTTLSGVPHTFDMIDRLSNDVLAAPSLRRVTQAGGRLRADAVERLGEQGVRCGWDLFVMYGQTEATARMAVLPPSRMFAAPASVGMAIPGGRLRIEPVPADVADAGVDVGVGVGEVVYSGPNVMMGYATQEEDLRRGYDIDELRTGDLGRFDAAGNLEIVGRLNRFVKLHGKRIDLDEVERRLSDAIVAPTKVAGDDEGVVVAVLDPSSTDPSLDGEMRVSVAGLLDVPAGRVLVLRLSDIATTGSGKIDGPALVESARALDRRAAESAAASVAVADAFAVVLGRRPHSGDSFASLGGDSFSYVEMSIRLESVLGALPSDWHLRPVAELESLRTRRSPPARWHRWSRSVDTSVVIRAIGILLIVCTHMRIFRVAGGAHALLAVAGYNVARFQLLPHDVPGRAKRAAVTVARIAVPASAWIGVNMLLAGGYSLGAMLLVNSYTGSSERSGGRWEYWYFEAFVQVLIVLGIVFAIRRVRRAEQAKPFAFALGVLGFTWLFRFEVVNLGGAYNEIFRPHTVACFVALGWCAQRATNTWQKLLVTVLAIVTTIGYFETVGRVDQLDRELRILAAVLALVWIRSIRIPTPVAMVVGKIAAASMWIFLLHWQVWPLFTPWLNDRVAYLITIGVGVATWWGVVRLGEIVAQRRIDGRSTSNQVSSAETAISSSDATPVSA